MLWKLPYTWVLGVQHSALGNHLSDYYQKFLFHLNSELCPILLESKIDIKNIREYHITYVFLIF